jgi:hypothetical protein
MQKLVHESVEEDLTIKFIIVDGVAESPVFEGNEEGTEGCIVQFHHQFQEYFSNFRFKFLHRLL